MSRKGNRGQGFRQSPSTAKPLPPPMIWECTIHGVQRKAGIQHKDKAICFYCMMDLFEKECGIMPELGVKAP